MKVSVYVFCLSALFCCTSVFAGLSTIDAAYEGIDAGGKQGIVLDDDEKTFGNGVIVIDTMNPKGELAKLLGDRVWGYCYELEQYVSSDYKEYNVDPLHDAIAADKAALISQLWALHYDHSWEQSTLIDTDYPANTLENQNALAFSFAIYEIIYDYEGDVDALDLTSGRLKGDAIGTDPPESFGIANAWLSDLLSPDRYNGPLAKLVSLNNSDKQDFIVEVPEPATMTMLVLGSLAFLRKRTL